ncbi:phage major capsid protein [Bradyrhizobium sp. CCBAU 53351]|uniref:phage major capsid protein n=1 Tax=Bradyrhizobium sp. CCBAU 53351 TaxID=1325114 RepID=UPI001886E096|nr:phage major capsid protein [Bradyrhizobium sp. CCBAU 53351]QOZ76721.1 phage major capsid protein [Bradyrhizobium sp. CCBAU 53351]
MKTAHALEFKDTGEADDPIASVAKELADLKAALETKAANDNTKLTERLDRIEAKVNRPGNRAANDNEPGLETKALNKYLRGGAGALDDLERKTLNLGTTTAGGYVVSPEYGKSVLEKVRQYSPLRGLASAMTIGTTEVYIPTLETDADGEGWVTETGNRTATEPVFGQLNIKTFENARYIPISQQLLEDADIDLLSFVAGHIAKITGKVEAKAFMIGDGNGKPTGLLNTPANYAFVNAAADGSDIVTALIDAFYKLPGAYAANGSWMMRRETMGLIRKMADIVIGTKGPIWSDGLANGTPPTLLGRPVYESIDMSLLPATTGTTYPVVFGDMASAYQIVDRVGLAVRTDDLTGADNGIVKVRWRRRVGGKPLLSEAAVVIKSTKP